MKEIAELTNSSKDRIVLAYSGGLQSAAAIPWLRENFDADVVTLTLDVGQGTELTAVRERALAAGAIRAHVIEARDELVRDYVLPSLQAGALYEGSFPLARALAQALLAKRLVDLAGMEGAVAVAHASRDNPSLLDVAIHALAPSLRVIVAELPPGSPDGRAVDVNLWGRTIDWERDLDAAPYTLTRAVNDCPEEPAFIEIEVDDGVPVRANGIEMPMLELVESLEIIAGAHGVGRVEGSGGTLRIVEEAPAAVVLHTALRHLESGVLPTEVRRVKNGLARTYANLIFRGSWHSPAREALHAFVRELQPRLTGSVRVELFKGNCRILEAGALSERERVEGIVS
ncbi:MAG: argininosuccinate synthase domain-containing protein [Vicinamibacterales bacterium]